MKPGELKTDTPPKKNKTNMAMEKKMVFFFQLLSWFRVGGPAYIFRHH